MEHARHHLVLIPKQARFYFGLDPNPSIDDIRAIADYYPVFRITYTD